MVAVLFGTSLFTGTTSAKHSAMPSVVRKFRPATTNNPVKCIGGMVSTIDKSVPSYIFGSRRRVNDTTVTYCRSLAGTRAGQKLGQLIDKNDKHVEHDDERERL